MTREDDFTLRPGRIRSRGAGGPKTFVGEALAAAQRAGGLTPRRAGRNSVFGRGRAASLAASRGLRAQARRAVIKARVVRHGPARAPLALHLRYLQREGVTQEGAQGDLFGKAGETVDGVAFAETCAPDRHHFRFIVAPEDAAELADLKAFTRDLMARAERDLATPLSWVAVDHWNTGQPHVHVIVRGRDGAGEDLVISRDYIAEGLRARASELVTLELGPRNERDIARGWAREVDADRWTGLDRQIARRADPQTGLVDLRPPRTGRPDGLAPAMVARVRRLNAMGLAQETRPGRWRVAPEAPATLQALGRRGDIIARLHRAMAGEGPEIDAGRLALKAEPGIIGRLVARGLDDELKGSAFAVVDGVDGRVHHVPLQDLADASDAGLGAIVELRAVGPRARLVLAVRSDLPLADQVSAQGATWLDRRLVGRGPAAAGSAGFGEAVGRALEERIDHLVAQDLARRQGRRLIFARDLLATLQGRELGAAAEKLAAATGLARHHPAPGDTVAGVFRRRLDLASGRFALVEGALGFALVPWRGDLERGRGQEVRGVMGPGGVIDWSAGRAPGPEI